MMVPWKKNSGVPATRASSHRRVVTTTSRALPFYSSDGGGGGGCSICGVCQICTCLQWSFLSSPTGIIKSVLTLTSLVCQVLCLWYGSKYSSDLGVPFHALLSASSASSLTSLAFLLVYLASEPTFYRVRPSLFEFAFSLLCAVFFLSSSSSLVYRVHSALFYFYHSMPGFHAYPAMTAAYVCGFISGFVHAIDALLTFRLHKANK